MQRAITAEGLLTTRQVAKKYGVLERDVLKAAREGKIPAQKLGGWIWVFPIDTLPAEWPKRQGRR